MTTITIKQNLDLKKTTFEDLAELWAELQDKHPVKLYAVPVESLSDEEKIAFERHQKAAKSTYVNFQG